MIVILTNANDPHPPSVMAALASRGAPVFRFNTEDYPQHVAITLTYGNSRVTGELTHRNGTILLQDITAVWYRRPATPEPHPALSQDDRRFVERETLHVLRGLTQVLGDRFWVNPVMSTFCAEHKPYQLTMARAVGLHVPRTVMTNDPDTALRFFEECGGRVIYKCFRSHGRAHNGGAWGLYTTLVTRDQLRTHLSQVALAPCIFQEYVDKDVEFRITVIGDHVFADEIRSQERASAHVDWRRPYMNPPLHHGGTIPDDLSQRLLALTRNLNLVFGCIDVVRTPDGQYVFLEINPNGQWDFVERYTGLPLTEHFAEMLAQGRPDYSMPADGVTAIS